MSFIHSHLLLGLRLAAIVQLLLSVVNLFLVRIMKWKNDLDRAPLLIREVFNVHCFFISVTLAIFGVMTWRFAPDIAGGVTPMGAWLAAGIGLFWGTRSLMQWSHYSAQHWRGDMLRTVIHFFLFFGYGTLAAVYLIAAWGS